MHCESTNECNSLPIQRTAGHGSTILICSGNDSCTGLSLLCTNPMNCHWTCTGINSCANLVVSPNVILCCKTSLGACANAQESGGGLAVINPVGECPETADSPSPPPPSPSPPPPSPSPPSPSPPPPSPSPPPPIPSPPPPSPSHHRHPLHRRRRPRRRRPRPRRHHLHLLHYHRHLRPRLHLPRPSAGSLRSARLATRKGTHSSQTTSSAGTPSCPSEAALGSPRTTPIWCPPAATRRTAILISTRTRRARAV